MNWGDPRLPERFWAKVAPCPMSGCWLWTGAVNHKGYGLFETDSTSVPHRFAYMMLIGEIPPKLQTDHRCRVRCCVNPAHLELVTNQENVRRAKALITHCPAGHPYDEQNTFVYAKNGSVNRSCRKCRVVYKRNFRERRRLAKSHIGTGRR
jgi:ferredoxin-like protein FixX